MGASSPFSASTLSALSNEVCTLAHAKSYSMRLAAHFEVINSKPDLKATDSVKSHKMSLGE